MHLEHVATVQYLQITFLRIMEVYVLEQIVQTSGSSAIFLEWNDTFDILLYVGYSVLFIIRFLYSIFMILAILNYYTDSLGIIRRSTILCILLSCMEYLESGIFGAR